MIGHDESHYLVIEIYMVVELGVTRMVLLMFLKNTLRFQFSTVGFPLCTILHSWVKLTKCSSIFPTFLVNIGFLLN